MSIDRRVKTEATLDLVQFFKSVDASTSTILELLAISIVEEGLCDNDDLKAAAIREAAQAVRKMEDQEDNEPVDFEPGPKLLELLGEIPDE